MAPGMERMVLQTKKNPFPYANDNKRYHTLSYALKQRFGRRVFKAVIDAGFTCPNLDGTKGTGGCTFCMGGSGEFTHPFLSVEEQIRMELARVRKKWSNAEVIAYFQPHTNTYAPLEKLKAVYETALLQEGVCGISIATRADALEPETVRYLEVLAKNTYLTVELGLQSMHDDTARRIHRGHTWQEFLNGYELLKSHGLRVCVHIINGLPGEDTAMMTETARALAGLKVDALKIHLLQIMRGTALAREYENGLVVPMTREDYLDTVCRQLELLPPETVIERITGDGAHDRLIAPRWCVDKISVLGSIDQTLARRDTWQGKYYIAKD